MSHMSTQSVEELISLAQKNSVQTFRQFLKIVQGTEYTNLTLKSLSLIFIQYLQQSTVVLTQCLQKEILHLNNLNETL